MIEFHLPYVSFCQESLVLLRCSCENLLHFVFLQKLCIHRHPFGTSILINDRWKFSFVLFSHDGLEDFYRVLSCQFRHDATIHSSAESIDVNLESLKTLMKSVAAAIALPVQNEKDRTIPLENMLNLQTIVYLDHLRD